MSSFLRRFRRRQARATRNRVTVDVGKNTAHKLAVNPNPVAMDDADKVHPLDPPHIAEALEEQHVMREEGLVPEVVEEPEDPLAADEGRPPLTQHSVDCVRVRVIKVTVDRLRKDLRKNKTPTKRLRYGLVKHLWFPEPFADHYQLRDGNPPSDSDRPAHMRGLDIVIDPWSTALVGKLARKFSAMAKLADITADPRPSFEVGGMRVRLPSKGIYR